MRNAPSLLVTCAISLFAFRSALAITIPTVPVGNVGNANDANTGGLYGGVAYAYRMGTTEVSNAQYAAFLNEKAKDDPLGLYNESMASNDRGGIMQSGVSPNFSYATKTNMADKPVNFVSWYDSIRFANWLNNGQGIGDTETGAYTLGALGAGGVPTGGLNITRNAGATWFLTSESEWYKSAYHQPAAQGGPISNYWEYPTASSWYTSQTIATANLVGDISNPGANVANFNFGANWNSQDGNVTTVGSAGPLSNSSYGTSDQGGNVWEWFDDLVAGGRVMRGGSRDNDSFFMLSSVRNFGDPGDEDFESIGFRVALVPEPSSLILAALGLIGLAAWGWRRKRITSPA